VLEAGEKRWPAPVTKRAEPAPAPPPKAEVKASPPAKPPGTAAGHHAPAPSAPSPSSGITMSFAGLVAAAIWLGLRFGQADAAAWPETLALLQHVTVFVMAVFVGFQVIWNVTPALHTPLMSVTNAISGIIVVGGLLGARGALHTSELVALIATLFATINIA